MWEGIEEERDEGPAAGGGAGEWWDERLDPCVVVICLSSTPTDLAGRD